jgi:ATP-dependent Clp protease ATP-binding subunit ClpA
MFERFTHGARETVASAVFQAKELGQPAIGTEHMLLALLADPQSPVALALRDTGVDERSVRAEIIRRTATGEPPTATSFLEADAEDTAALKSIGIDLDEVRRAIEANFDADDRQPPVGPEPQPTRRRRLFADAGRPRFSPRAKKSLELALREAVQLKNNFIAREHLMLGILREGQGPAVQILTGAGVDLDRLRADLTRSLGEKAA